MKNIYYLRLWLIAAMLSIAYSASAYDAYVNGFFYNLNETDRTAEVTYPYEGATDTYKGKIVIPEAFVYNGKKYTVTSIGEHAFDYCSGLRSITIPNSVTSIGETAFWGCTGLKSITIPNSVTSIGRGAFFYCTGLTSITIPNSVTSIGSRAFGTGLKEVHISDLAAWCNIDFSEYDSNPLYYAHNLYLNDELITDLVIPNSVTSIGKYAFYVCKGISKITIPKTVKKIGYNAFACNEKSEVYVEWDDLSDETLSFAQQPFSDEIMQYGTLYVPTGTMSLYEQYDPWRNFFNIKEYTPSGIEEIEAEDGVTIGVEGGKIVVAGAKDAKVEVFGTNGAAVYSGSADNLPELAAGIYIVRIGSTVKKVAIAK